LSITRPPPKFYGTRDILQIKAHHVAGRLLAAALGEPVVTPPQLGELVADGALASTASVPAIATRGQVLSVL